MGRVCSRFKGLLSERIWVENYIYRSFQNVPTTPGHTIAWIGAIVLLLVYSNFGRPYISHPNFDSRVFGLYEKLFESRIQSYASD